MFGLDPFTISAAYILANTLQCPTMMGEIDVDVRIETKRKPYITSQSSSQMTAHRHDEDSTFSTDGRWMVGGLTRSKFTSEARADYTLAMQGGQACMAVTKVTYVITYEPEVFIASDYLKMGCRYSVTVQHEERHVDTDERVLREYQPVIDRVIRKYAGNIGMQGPFPKSQVEDMKEEMLHKITTAIEPFMKQMADVRRKRQAALDTEANYRRETAICPGQFPKFNGSK